MPTFHFSFQLLAVAFILSPSTHPIGEIFARNITKMAPIKPFMDYYFVLSVRPLATTKEIKEAYLKFTNVALCRPLLGNLDSKADPGPLPPRFALLREAYETLTDTHKRSVFHNAWEEDQVEKIRKRYSIPEDIEDSLTDIHVSQTAARYWTVKLLVLIRRVLWFRLKKIETFVEHPTLKVDAKVKYQFYLWFDDAERCMTRLGEVRHEIESSKDWDEDSLDAHNTAKELMILHRCCTAWLRAADRVIKRVGRFFDEDMAFVYETEYRWAERTFCEGELCEAVLVWEQARFDEVKHLRRSPKKNSEARKDAKSITE
jgi:hypothetical protein